MKKKWGYKALFVELNKRVEAATSSYSATGEFLQYIYSMFVDKNHQKIRSRCLAHEFSFKDIFNDINHGYKAGRIGLVTYGLKSLTN